MQKISRPNAVQHDDLIYGQKISWPKKAQPKTKSVGEKLKARFAQKFEIVRTNIAKLDNIIEEEVLTSADTPTTPYSSEPAEMAEFVIKEILQIVSAAPPHQKLMKKKFWRLQTPLPPQPVRCNPRTPPATCHPQWSN